MGVAMIRVTERDVDALESLLFRISGGHVPLPNEVEALRNVSAELSTKYDPYDDSEQVAIGGAPDE